MAQSPSRLGFGYCRANVGHLVMASRTPSWFRHNLAMKSGSRQAAAIKAA
jgi:hypothetical protein